MENLGKAAVTKGLIIAGVGVFIQLAVYYAAPNLLGNMVFSIGLGLVLLLLYIFMTIALRKEIGGFWTFKQAFSGILLMAIVANLSAGIFNFAYYKVVEPDAAEKVMGYVTEGVTKTMESFGANEEQIDKAVRDSEASIKSQYDPTIWELAKTQAIGICVAVILSLIFAAIFKKERPVFLSEEQS